MKYRKMPIVIDAVQFDGTEQSIVKMIKELDAPVSMWTCSPQCLVIPTLEGNHLAMPGDWIIKGIKGEFYPCKDSIFRLTYEDVSD